jgi:hypothetical protein
MSTTSTGAQSRLGELVLIWLLTRPNGDTKRELGDALAPLLEQRWSGAERTRALDEEFTTLERTALIQSVRKSSLVLTDGGRRAGLVVLGLKALPAGIKWDVLKKKYLFACALGLPPAQASREMDKGNVSAAILARHQRLELGDYPTPIQVEDALVLRALGIETKEKLTLNLIRKLFLNRLLGGTRPQEPGDALAQLAAKAVAARRANTDELQAAVIRRWLDGLEAVPEVKATVAATPGMAAPGAVAPREDDGTFAARVIATARSTKTGRFGSNKVFISHIFRKLVDEGVIPADSEAFKERLVVAHLGGLLSLSRADLVEAMEAQDVDTSETRYRGATFHFVRIEN